MKSDEGWYLDMVLDKVKISFIVPVYNVEKYLKECLESILLQEGDYEIVLVDDGSTDLSGEICDEYAKKYRNVKAYHKPNGGLSDARNYGLSRAEGEYVAFVDSDDSLSAESVSIIMNALTKYVADVYIWDYVITDEKGNEIDYFEGKYKHPTLIKDTMYSTKDFLMAQIDEKSGYVRTASSGIYCKDFLLNNNLWFEKGILHEDELWTPKVFVEANNIYYLGENLYYYRMRADSITNKKNKDYSKYLSSIIYIYNTLPAYFDYAVQDDMLAKRLKADISNRYLSSISKYDAYKYRKISKKIDRCLIIRNAKGIKNKLRSSVLVVNIGAYCLLNKLLRR